MQKKKLNAKKKNININYMFLNNKTLFFIMKENNINNSILKDIIYKLSCKINIIIFGEINKYEREDVYNINYISLKDMDNYLKLIKLYNPELIIYVNYKNDYIINLNNYFKIPYYFEDFKNFKIIDFKRNIIKIIIKNNMNNVCLINNKLKEDKLNILFNEFNNKFNTYILSNDKYLKKEINTDNTNIYIKTLLYNVCYNKYYKGLKDVLKNKFINTVFLTGILNSHMINLIKYLKKNSIKYYLIFDHIDLEDEDNIEEKVYIKNTLIIKNLMIKNIKYDFFDINKIKLLNYKKKEFYKIFFIYKKKIYIDKNIEDQNENKESLEELYKIKINNYFIRQNFYINYDDDIILNKKNFIYFKLDIDENKFNSLNLRSLYDTYKTFTELGIYKNISIFSIFRDNELYIKNMILMLNNLKKNNFHFYNYFYENDSKDNTKNQLKNYILHNSGILKSEDINKKHYSGIIKERFVNLSNYRNESLKLSKKIYMTEWSLILDSNIYFNKNIINNMLYEYYNKNDDDIVMITVYGNDLSILNHYYDLIAFETKNNLINNNACFFKKCKRKECKKIKEKLKYDNNKIFEVNSAFAGMCLIKSEILNKVKWSSNGSCEHINFCKEVRKYGKIILIPWLENYWDK
jgi:hypothetical protein